MNSPQPIMKKGPLFLAREGLPFLAIFLLLSLVGWYYFWPVGLVFGILFLFSINFFRDPERRLPSNPQLMISPADGKVLKVEILPAGPYLKQPHQKISIFMSALDVHVNRIPCDGIIKEIHYFPGQFFVASLDKASEKNERNAVVLETPSGQQVAFVQIAGLVARRIVCYLKQGMPVRRGERYGMIRFGSRLEICIPPSWIVVAQVGQMVKAGMSPLAEMKD